MGVASCASTACHNEGRGRETKGSEYTTWAAHDRHTRAYNVLFTPRASDMAKNLALANDGGKVIPAHQDLRCLKCHAMSFGKNGKEATDSHFYLGDGVGCESCHGPASNYLTEHFRSDFKNKSAKEKEEVYGLRNTKSLKSRVQICAQCHIGSADKEVDHDIMAAGHPRLNFEFSGYMNLYNKHWPLAADKERYPDYETRTWVVGQVASAKSALELLEGRAGRAAADGGKKWPEFTEYGCYACHKDLGVSDLKHPAARWKLADDKRRPGTLPWGTWYFSPFVDAGPLSDLKELKDLRDQMQLPAPDAATVAGLAKKAAARLGDDVLNKLDGWPASKGEPIAAAQLYQTLLAKGEAGARGMEWDDAAQLYIALVSLYPQLPADPARKEALKNLAVWLRAAFPEGIDSPKHYRPLEKPTLEEQLKALK